MLYEVITPVVSVPLSIRPGIRAKTSVYSTVPKVQKIRNIAIRT